MMRATRKIAGGVDSRRSTDQAITTPNWRFVARQSASNAGRLSRPWRH
jgi:hypothetical protein